ncbi:MAG: VWA domain-containing protein [Thermoanaerobaculia bacterium]
MNRTTFRSRTAILAARTAALVTLALGSASGALAQGTAGAPPAESPLLKEGIRRVVQVTAMDLDVVATTKDGTPVNDLRKEDFVMKVDGRTYPIDYFTHVDSGTLHGPDLGQASPDLILETTAGDGGDRYLSRQFLIFFDDEHLLPFERQRVTEGLRDLITRLTPSDRVALVAYGGSSRVVVPFTSSKEALLDGLSRMDKIPPSGIRWESDYRRTVSEAQRSRPGTRQALINAWSQQVRAREKGTLDDLRRAVAALAARSGKRVLIYVSDGLELHPGQSFQQALGSLLSQWDESVLEDYRRVVAEANQSGITIHSFDAKGLTTDGDAGSSSPSPFSSFITNQNLRESLAGFANETGGLVVTNRNNFQPALDRIYRESSSYYAIGITLAAIDSRKSREHKIDVRSTRPGVTVRTRTSYATKTADQAVRDRIEMALMTPDASGDFPVGLAIASPRKGGGLGKRLAGYDVTIPLSSLTFTDEGGKKTAVFDVVIAAAQDTGARSEIVPVRRTITVQGDKWPQARGESFHYTGELKSGTGNYRFVAAVRDVATDRTGLASQATRIE